MEVINVMASSLDGLIGSTNLEGDSSRRDSGLSSTSDLMHLQALMAQSDAIIVGASSIRSNKECLALSKGRQPSWYIYCQQPIPADYFFWQQKSIPRTLVTQESMSVISNEVDNLVYGSDNPAEFLYNHLVNCGYKKVLLFGGGYVNLWFYQKALVDRLILTLAPLMIAQKNAPKLLQAGLNKSQKFTLEECRQDGDYLFLNYKVKAQ